VQLKGAPETGASTDCKHKTVGKRKADRALDELQRLTDQRHRVAVLQ
jgi:hypothetical protein